MAHLQLVCFVLALVHLSLGHCWRLVNASTFREVIGNLGWVPILVLDFMVVLGLLVFPGMELPAWALAAGGVGLVMVLAGGVAANSLLRREMQARCDKMGIPLYMPKLSLCGDNAAMIGSAAYFRLKNGETADLSLNAKPALRL